MTSGSTTRHRNQEQHERMEHDREQARRKHLISRVAWAVGIVVVVGIVAAGLLTSRPTQTVSSVAAPTFTLPDTAGGTVSLADYQGKNVILYFSEGAGCQACLVQMADIEKKKAEYDAANFVVLPIVMNTKEQITADMAANGVTTPFLLDDGTVSTDYKTIGKGMHAGLPGHSFVVIDANGVQRWFGEYPGMWLNPDELLAQAEASLTS
jgi:peroxiredoxin